MNQPRFSAFKSSKWCRRVIWATAVFLIYVLLGFFAVPPLIKWQMLKRLPGLTQRQAAIDQVKFNPLALSLTVRGLALTEPTGRPFASWEELYVNFQTSSLFRWAWTFKEIRLVKPVGEIILLKDGQLNFANMFVPASNAPAPPKPEKASIPRVNIFLLEITNGFVALEDQTRRSPFHTEYRPINVTLTDFATRPGADTPYSFRAESDAGRSLAWEGAVTVQPLRSFGHVAITGVQLTRYQPYLEDITRAVVTNGTADVEASYRFEAGTNGVDLIVTNGLVHVEQMRLQDPDTGETVAGLQGLDLRQAQFNLRERALRFGSVRVSEATLLARLKPGGHLNLLDLLSLRSPATNATPAAVAAGPPWTLTVDDFALENTAVALEDLTHRTTFKTQLKPIVISLKDFTTRAESDARYSFHLTSEAAETFEGAGTLSINPVRSAGEVKLTTIELKKYLPFIEEVFTGKLAAGKLGVRAPYMVALATNGLQAAVSNLAVSVKGLEVKAPGSEESVTSIADFTVERVAADLRERRARIGQIRADGGSLLIRRQKDGTINLLGLLASGAGEAPPATSSGGATSNAPAAGGANGWVVEVEEFALQDYSVKIDDQQPLKPAAFLLDHLALNVKAASTVSSAPITAAVSLRFNETGAITAQGTARLTPLTAKLQIGLTNLDLTAFQSYLDQFVRLGVVSGALNAFGQARYQTTDPGAPLVSYAGGVSITNFLCTDQVAFKEFARWDQLSLAGIECELQPNRFKLEEVTWVAPKASILIGADHRPNLALILKPVEKAPAAGPGQPAPTQAQAHAGPESFPVQVGTVRLERASCSFADESLQPRATMSVQELTGTIKGLSSVLNTTAEVDLAGKVDQQSPISIRGRINPLASDLLVDLFITNANTQLTSLTSYMEKYAGHPLNKGRVSTSLHYHIEGGELKAENKIGIDHLTLGPRNKSPDATGLPVKLAVALLKDANGRIELDLPVQGRLDDPQFSLGPIIVKVLLNTLTKVVASPFKLLGALVGGGEEMSFVEFVPGSTNLVEGELDKLTKLNKALAQRPALNLEIEGAIDPVADWAALARSKLRDQLKAQRLRELAAKGKALQSAESFELAAEDYEQLVRAAFAEKFGTNIAAVIETNRLALASTNQPGGTQVSGTGPKSKASVYQRVLAMMGLSKNSHRSPAEKHLSKADRLALDQATPALMETLVASQVPVTADDYRELMDLRVRWVRDWLSRNGQIEAERLLLVAPKAVDAAYSGGSRVNLSLD